MKRKGCTLTKPRKHLGRKWEICWQYEKRVPLPQESFQKKLEEMAIKSRFKTHLETINLNVTAFNVTGIRQLVKNIKLVIKSLHQNCSCYLNNWTGSWNKSEMKSSCLISCFDNGVARQLTDTNQTLSLILYHTSASSVIMISLITTAEI